MTAVPAAASPGVEVTLGGRVLTVSGEQITAAADVPSTSFTLRGGGTVQQVQHGGLSVHKLLVLAGANPATVTFVQIPRADGRTYALLNGADLSASPPFPEGPPLVFVDGPSTHFFRPVRGATDDNAADNIATVSDAPLAMTARTGALLSVSATVDKPTASAATPLAFTATVAGARSGETVVLTWHFDDGTPDVSGSSVSHTYATAGTYDAYVTAQGDQDSGGSSDILRVQVGPAATPDPEAAKPGSGTGPTKNSPATGPKNSGGTGRDGTTGDTPGPGGSSGETDGPSSPATTTDGSTPAQTQSVPDTTTPSSPTASTDTTAVPSDPSAGRTTPSGTTNNDGTQVSGLLLASSSPAAALALAASASGSRAAARAGTPAAPDLGPPLLVLSALAALGFGVWRERRSTR